MKGQNTPDLGLWMSHVKFFVYDLDPEIIFTPRSQNKLKFLILLTSSDMKGQNTPGLGL